jgi:hypothetical protein
LHRNRSSGQISIFSAIILLVVLALAGILVDISRISAGRAIVKSAAEAAASSLLADYGSRLKEGYGLFAMPADGTDSLQDRFEEYLTCNLSIPDEEEYYSGKTDLFGFRIEAVRVTPVFNLSENSVAKEQILEYMKYRAPTEIVEGFVGKLSAMKDIGKMSEAYKKKVGIDKLLGRMDKSQQKLKKSVDGSGSENPGEKYINGFNLGGSWESAFASFNSLAAELSFARSRLDSIDSSISALEEQLRRQEAEAKENTREKEDSSGAGNNTGSDVESTAGSGTGTGNNAGSATESAAEQTRTSLESLRAERLSLQQEYSDTNSGMQTVWNELRYSLTGDFIKANDNAVNEIQQIIEKGKLAQAAITDLEAYLKENFGGEPGELSENFREDTQKELDRLKALILEGQKAEAMLKDVGDNSSLLKDVAGKLDAARSTIETASSEAGLPANLLDAIKSYINIQYNYSRPQKGDKKDDPRKGKADAIRNFIVEKILKDVDYTTTGIDKEDLPSFTKRITPDYAQEDARFTGRSREDEAASGRKTAGVEYGGDLEEVDREADLYDEEGMFQENALGFVADIGKMASEKAKDLRDNIYINEYIMGTFKNSVPEIQQGDGTVKDTDLHGIEKSGLTTFYDSEVEYILHGNASQKANNIMTRGEILLVRFGLNTLHVYTDAKKKTMASGIATAVAGWWTGGAGVPILSNLIMAGWGMGEALIDLQNLMAGKSVPIYKMKGDWQLDIGLPSDSTPETDKRLYFNYHDYLRLFLLTMSEEKKLNRIEDLIQLNIGKAKSGFKMAECATYVRIEAEVSMKYLFITQPFIQRTVKTTDGRYLFKVLLYEGYK